MPDIPRSHLVIYGVAVLLVLVFGVRQVAAARRAQAPADDGPSLAVQRAAGNGGGGRVVVQVAGDVRRPGVYRLRSSARVVDAVRRAGGARAHADLTQVNLAQKLADGRQIVVPARTPAAAAAAAPGAAPAGPLNLNTATLEQLDGLDGIGPITAQHILDYRKAHGGFANVDELDSVPGIGPTTLAALRDEVTA